MSAPGRSTEAKGRRKGASHGKKAQPRRAVLSPHLHPPASHQPNAWMWVWVSAHASVSVCVCVCALRAGLQGRTKNTQRRPQTLHGLWEGTLAAFCGLGWFWRREDWGSCPCVWGLTTETVVISVVRRGLRRATLDSTRLLSMKLPAIPLTRLALTSSRCSSSPVVAVGSGPLGGGPRSGTRPATQRSEVRHTGHGYVTAQHQSPVPGALRRVVSPWGGAEQP